MSYIVSITVRFSLEEAHLDRMAGRYELGEHPTAPNYRDAGLIDEIVYLRDLDIYQVYCDDGCFLKFPARNVFDVVMAKA